MKSRMVVLSVEGSQIIEKEKRVTKISRRFIAKKYFKVCD